MIDRQSWTNGMSDEDLATWFYWEEDKQCFGLTETMHRFRMSEERNLAWTIS